ncbi:MAG: AzlC family ABC transporter permease [Tissierellia bacterium]|nr:AzlC family ABC transporter permease [Tissierellia bacterium]
MEELKRAFPITLPILITYFFLGMGFGLVVKGGGHGALISLFMSVYIYGGALQFATVGLFSQAFHPLNAILLALSVNLRYLFYSVSLLGRLRGVATWKKLAITHFASDETFSIYVSSRVKGPGEMLAVGLLNFIYWAVASVLGALLGAALPMDARGIEFMMTALFLVIVLDQWKEAEDHTPALLGFGAAILSLVAFGMEGFMLPAMVLILLGSLIYRKRRMK